jgi:hypothetical protein
MYPLWLLRLQKYRRRQVRAKNNKMIYFLLSSRQLAVPTGPHRPFPMRAWAFLQLERYRRANRFSKLPLVIQSFKLSIRACKRNVGMRRAPSASTRQVANDGCSMTCGYHRSPQWVRSRRPMSRALCQVSFRPATTIRDWST